MIISRPQCPLHQTPKGFPQIRWALRSTDYTSITNNQYWKFNNISDFIYGAGDWVILTSLITQWPMTQLKRCTPIVKTRSIPFLCKWPWQNKKGSSMPRVEPITTPYRSFLLRCWQERSQDATETLSWRFSLREVAEIPQEQSFSGAEQLIDFLLAKLGEA